LLIPEWHGVVIKYLTINVTMKTFEFMSGMCGL